MPMYTNHLDMSRSSWFNEPTYLPLGIHCLIRDHPGFYRRGSSNSSSTRLRNKAAPLPCYLLIGVEYWSPGTRRIQSFGSSIDVHYQGSCTADWGMNLI